MDPQIVEVIKEVTEFFKSALTIIGTPLVTGYVGYKVAKLQYKSKLDEISKNHEFQAKEHLFNLYKERQREYSEEKAKIEHSLGQVAGVFHVSNISTSNESNIAEPFLRLIPVYIKIAEINNNSLVSEYSSKKIVASDYFKLLKNNEKLLLEAKEPIQSIYTLIEVYTILEACNQYLLELEMENVFSSYTTTKSCWKFW